MVNKIIKMIRKLSPFTRKWLGLNIAIMAVAMIVLWRGARSGNGRISLSALSRTMPLDESIKTREKRLRRLLANKHFEGPEMTPLLIQLALGTKPPPWVPIVVDQTTIQGVQTIMAGILVANRLLPVAFACFTYPQIHKSQNSLEFALLQLIATSLPPGCKPLFVMDRGYARVELLHQLKMLGIAYLIRTKKKVTVTVHGKTMWVGRLRKRRNKAIRYTNILYHGEKKEAVDLVAFHDPPFKEPWYLVLPPQSQDLLADHEVVDLYRARMHIELTFRDWKTHLGVRGLRLQVNEAVRLSRLLLALTTAYILAVLMGEVRSARIVRRHCEILRSKPRHGTRRKLSALSIGILLLSLKRFETLAQKILFSILAALSRGIGGRRLIQNHYA